MPTILITGGTGLIGKALSKALLERGYKVIVLTRKIKNQPQEDKGVEYREWIIENEFIDKPAIQQADYIVHLAGAGVAEKRWTEKRKKEIVESRTKSSALIVKSLKEIPNKVKAVISASAIGWYGADVFTTAPKPFIETNPANHDFLGETCRHWEESIEPISVMNKRLIKLRTGIVLSREGGVLKEFRRPLRFGIAAILGSGNQMISWIHIDDLCRMYIQAIENENLNGTYNAVGPNPVNNRTLTLTLAKAIKGNFFIPIHIPSFILKMILGEMSIEVLKSATVSADKIRQSGFQFLFPTIDSAIKELKIDS